MSPKCYACGGLGKKTCHYCKGSGVMARKTKEQQEGKKKSPPCPHCGGAGQVACHVCGGSGRR
jgi:DnaJ-class molecular chaperone